MLNMLGHLDAFALAAVAAIPIVTAFASLAPTAIGCLIGGCLMLSVIPNA